VLPSAELQISRLCSAKDGAASVGGPVLSRAWAAFGRQGALAHCKVYRRVGDHQARAIRLKDAGRRQNPAMAGDFPTIHLSAITGGKK
jgi:hypothetical protein